MGLTPVTDADIIHIYIKDIANCRRLSREEEYELAEKKDKGDKDARDKLIRSQLPWVVKLAKKHSKCREDLLENLQQGSCGLIRAVDRFDCSRGSRLSTYASYFIRRYMLDYDKTLIRLPRYVSSLQRCGRMSEETAERVNRCKSIKSIERHDNARYLSRTPTNDFEALDEELDKREMRHRLDMVVEELPLKLQSVVKLRLVGTTWRKVGKTIGTSAEAARQLGVRACYRLRDMLGDSGFDRCIQESDL